MLLDKIEGLVDFAQPLQAQIIRLVGQRRRAVLAQKPRRNAVCAAFYQHIRAGGGIFALAENFAENFADLLVADMAVEQRVAEVHVGKKDGVYNQVKIIHLALGAEGMQLAGVHNNSVTGGRREGLCPAAKCAAAREQV